MEYNKCKSFNVSKYLKEICFKEGEINPEISVGWDSACEKSFRRIIELLTTAPILAYSDFSRTFHLSTDASNIGVGAVLSQQYDVEGREKPIFFGEQKS